MRAMPHSTASMVASVVPAMRLGDVELERSDDRLDLGVGGHGVHHLGVTGHPDGVAHPIRGVGGAELVELGEDAGLAVLGVLAEGVVDELAALGPVGDAGGGAEVGLRGEAYPEGGLTYRIDSLAYDRVDLVH